MSVPALAAAPSVPRTVRECGGELEPHGLLGRTAAAVKVGVQGRRALDRIYRRIDAALSGKLGPNALVDPFEEVGERIGIGGEGARGGIVRPEIFVRHGLGGRERRREIGHR